MGGLRVLDLTGNPLDEVTGELIAAWVELRELTLDHTNIKDLAPIATPGRTALKRLSLAGTPVGDEQLALLGMLKNLELLDLTGCPITDHLDDSHPDDKPADGGFEVRPGRPPRPDF